MLLTQVCARTNKYIETVSKAKRKGLGQFFTSKETAEYMASLCEWERASARILDPGAGSGILCIALIEKLVREKVVNTIDLVCYENDLNIISLLEENLSDAKAFCNGKGVVFNFDIRTENFIFDNTEAWQQKKPQNAFDIVICNPPYKKISRKSSEAIAMEEIVHGQPNIYFLFMAMALNLLKIGGEYIFIVPRSWTSGLYFNAFRQYFFSNINLENIHLFISRNKVFDKETVLQETMILSGTRAKNKQQEEIVITTSNGASDFDGLQKLRVDKRSCFQTCNGRYFFLPISQAEIQIIKKVNAFNASVEERGYKFRTGRVVDFRNREFLKSKEAENTCPLIWPSNFIAGRIQHPIIGAENQYILKSCKPVLMPDVNYLMIKRFTSKEEKRRLQPALYISTSDGSEQYISTENHLNYLTKKDGEFAENELFGFYVLLASTLWDQYYRILNGSTQVNAAELNTMPIPPIEDISAIGQLARACNASSTADCDKLLEDFYEN